MYFWREPEAPANLVYVGAQPAGLKQIQVESGEGFTTQWVNTPAVPGTPMLAVESGGGIEYQPYSPVIHDVYNSKAMGLPDGFEASRPYYFFGVRIGDDVSLKQKLSSMGLEPDPSRFLTIAGKSSTSSDGRDTIVTLYMRDGASMKPIVDRIQREGSTWVGIRDNVVKPYISVVLAVVGAQGVFGMGATGGYTGVAASTVETGAMNAALAESAVGSAGYGASSVGAGTGAYEGAAMWEGFNFSSGESTPFFGDAQITDFGGGYTNVAENVSGVNGWEYGPTPEYGSGQPVFGNTPEVVTNNYGTNFDPSFSDPTANFYTPEPITIEPPALSSGGWSPEYGNIAGQVKSFGGQVNDVLGTFSNVLKSIGIAAGTAAGVKTQLSNPPVTNNQLKPTGGASPSLLAGMSPMMLLLGGVVLVGGIYLVAKKG